MVRHFIIMSSAYSKGARIALDLYGENLNFSTIEATVNKIKEQCGKDVSLSMHFIDTTSERWASVTESDPFFKGVSVFKNIDTFIDLIKKGLTLKGIDVAKFISSKKEYTHLELEKLTYLCYAEYLCANGERLFEDNIYAYRYGPVVESVYKYYKKGDLSEILFDNAKSEEEDIDKVYESCEQLPITGKILFAYDGVNKIQCINETISKYARFSGGELINLTHVKGGAWDRTPQSTIIPDELIKKYHYLEII